MLVQLSTYLLESALLLLCCAIGYWLLFRRSTFLHWNRMVLWCVLMGSVVLPLIHLPEGWTVLQKHQQTLRPTPVEHLLAVDVPQQEAMHSTTPAPEEVVTMPVSKPIDYARVLLFVYLSGVIMMGLRLLVQVLSLLKLYRKARIEKRGGYRLAICPGGLSPFAFGSVIFIPESLYATPEFELVLTHELAHVRQRHTLDLLLAELTLIWQWFNPGAWLYRRLVEVNLEYLADRSVLQQQWNKKQYQLSLLNWSNFNTGNSLSTSYNFSLLKERIMMMNRNPSSKLYALRYALIGLLLPMLPMFNRPISASTISENFTTSVLPLDGKTQLSTITLAEKDIMPEKRLTSASTVVVQMQNPAKTAKSAPTNMVPSNDTIPKAPVKKISVLLVIIDKDITTVEMEALEKIELPLNKKIVFTADANGKLKGLDLNSGGGGCGITVDEHELYPLVIHGVEGGCGTQSFDLAQLEKIHAGLIQEGTQVILGGIPQDPSGFEAYKAKMLGIQYDEHKKRVAALEAKNWEEVTEDAHDTFSAPVSDAGIQNITTRMERCLKANKELMVVINNGKPQSSIPALKELNIKRMETHRKSKFYYLKGTTQIVRSEWLGLRVEIFTN